MLQLTMIITIRFLVGSGFSLPLIFSWHTLLVRRLILQFHIDFVIIERPHNFSFSDGIDGKQARRIGLSGPLGELFDHGLDSYSASLIPLCLYSVFGRGEQYSVEPMRFYYVELCILFNFHVSHWEKYNTGVLYLPWGYDLGEFGTKFLNL
jgi:hypothetical protein